MLYSIVAVPYNLNMYYFDVQLVILNLPYFMVVELFRKQRKPSGEEQDGEGKKSEINAMILMIGI